jgi:hypothetical protein
MSVGIAVTMLGTEAKFAFDLALAAVLSVGIERLGAAIGHMRGGEESDGGMGGWRWGVRRPRSAPDRRGDSRAPQQASPRRRARF